MTSPWAKREDLLISLPNIIAATNNFHEDNLVGEGGFGKVYRGKLPEPWPKATVAIKRLDGNNPYAKPQFLNELSMLSCCCHPNIITLIGYCDQGNEMIVVSEYAVHGSLDKYLTGSNSLTWGQRLKICIGAAQGLAYLHSRVLDHQQMIHRDVKCGNVLLDENLEAKITDFGMSKLSLKDQQHTMIAGTDGYFDPIYFETSLVTTGSDVYSFGVVLLEMLSSKLAFEKWSIDGGEPHRLIEFVKSFGGWLDKIIDPRIRDEINPKSRSIFEAIALPCISLKVTERPTMEKLTRKLKKALSYQDNKVKNLGDATEEDNGGGPVILDGSKLNLRLIKGARAKRVELGGGWFGKTYKLDGVNLVVKEFVWDWLCASKKQFRQQMEIIGNIKHENVVPLLGYYYSKPSSYSRESPLQFYEHNVQGSVSSMLHGENKISLDWDARLRIAVGVARGIAHIHTQANGKFVHGNIRASNIFLNSKGYGCIRDTGLWKMSRSWRIKNFGGYEPPDVIHSYQISQKSDVYSFGVLLLHLLSGKMPAHISGGFIVERLVKVVLSQHKEVWVAKFADKDLKKYPHVEEEMVQMFQIGIECATTLPEDRPNMTNVVNLMEDIRPSMIVDA